MDSEFGNSSVFCGRCAHPLPDETQTFCGTCGGAFSKYPPTSDFVLLVERQIEVANIKHRRKRNIVIGSWVSLCLGLFLIASVLFKQTQIDRFSAEREIEFYVTNLEGFPEFAPDRAREAVLVALQSFEDHFGIKIKRWSFREGEIPNEISTLIKSLPAEKISDLGVWQNYFRSKLYPGWHQNPYKPLKVFITNFPLKAPDFLRMETRHLSSSKLVGGFATPAFVMISSYRMLTEIDEKLPKNQSRYVGEYLIAHELGHALLGLPDFVASPEFTEFSARGIASAADSPFSKCLMHTDEGGGQAAWGALRNRELGQAAECYSYAELLRAHEIHRDAIGSARSGNIDLAGHQLDMALALLPKDKSLPWLRELWTEERRLLSRF